PPAGERLALDSEESFEDRPVRLMILANYSGFPEESHYLERAFRSLGEEPFAFHGEVRPLPREEVGPFIERSLAACADDRGAAFGPAGLGPEAVDLIYRFSQGFPSYIHELLRLVCAFPPHSPRGDGGALPPHGSCPDPQIGLESLSRILGLEDGTAPGQSSPSASSQTGPLPAPPSPGQAILAGDA